MIVLNSNVLNINKLHIDTLWKHKHLIILFVLIICTSLTVNAKTAYFGIVGIGKGMGVFGHAFLLIKEKNQPYLIGDTYQYNIYYDGINDRADEDRSLVKSLFDMLLAVKEIVLQDASAIINFSLKKQKFFQIFKNYTSKDDRIISLYELNMDDQEVDKLIALLNNDLNDVHFAEKHVYGLNDNCVTEIIKIINKVVESRKQLELIAVDISSLQEVKAIASYGSKGFLNQVPFYIAKTLENHPISKGRVQLYERDTIRIAKFVSSIYDDTNKIALYCKWNPKTKITVESYIVLYLIDPKKYPIDPIITLVTSYEQSRSELKKIVLKLYQMLDDEIEKQKLYYLFEKI